MVANTKRILDLAENRLVVDDVTTGYLDHPAVRNVNLQVASGEVVALLGANGAGKTTLIKAVVGLLSAWEGSIYLNGEKASSPTFKRVRAGIGWLPDTRSIFMGLSVEENLRLGRGDKELALETFPELKPLLKRRGGVLSGGQQQMLAVARVLASRPQIVLADELSVGLAPQIVDRLLEELWRASRRGAAVLLVEQFARIALDVADRSYVLRRGELVFDGSATELLSRDISDLYL